jgi:hypothetical protein
MPKWMKELEVSCSDQRTPINVKLFIVKLVINLPDVFEPYAKYTDYFPRGIPLMVDLGLGFE